MQYGAGKTEMPMETKARSDEVTKAIESLDKAIRMVLDVTERLEARCVRVMRNDSVAKCDEKQAEPPTSVPLAREIYNLTQLASAEYERLDTILKALEI